MNKKKILPTTLLLVIKDNQILLACKKRGFGIGKYNGVGGKVEQGETIEQGMIRETFEEIGIVPKDYKLRGIITFDEYYKGEPTFEVTHIFVANDYDGVPQETDEMKPFWFNIESIPYDKMFPDDKFWLPMVISGKNVIGEFVFDKDFNKLAQDIHTTTDKELQMLIAKGE